MKTKTKGGRIKSVLKKAVSRKSGKSINPERFELIRAKAYEFYEKRGGVDGNDWADWFEAERQIGLD